MTQREVKLLRSQAAITAMQGLLSNPDTFRQFDENDKYKEIGEVTKVIALSSVMYADALVEQLKKV